MEEIRRSLLEKVCRRMAEEFGIQKRPQGDTEKFDHVLALWIDLQRAIHLRESHDRKPEGCTPWNCPDPRISAAWEALTNPKNVHALESLFYQLPEGPQMEMARKALQVCRERAKN
jgi:hypothetical protein